MKSLIFNVKRNLQKPPKVFVLSPDKKTTYGSFSASNPEEFTNWQSLSKAQAAELKQYIHNLQATSNFFGDTLLGEQTDFRLRLPISFIKCINHIHITATENNIEMDIFKPIVASILEQLKTTASKFPESKKLDAINTLEKLLAAF